MVALVLNRSLSPASYEFQITALKALIYDNSKCITQEVINFIAKLTELCRLRINQVRELVRCNCNAINFPLFSSCNDLRGHQFITKALKRTSSLSLTSKQRMS